MRCDQVLPLLDPYLDSELDTRTILEIERHLGGCPDCGRRFADAEKVQARIKAALGQGARTPELWARIERAVAASAPESNRARASNGAVPGGGWLEVLRAFGEQVRAGWRGSRRAWAGLALAWGVILALNNAAKEAESGLASRPEVPTAREMRLALKQKQTWMAELADISDAAPAPKAKEVLPRPHSDRGSETLNL